MKRITKYFLNTVIVFYLSIIYFSGVPESNTLNVKIKEQAVKAAFILGVWPSWSMFAPNPIKFDSKSYVEVEYANGEKKEYDVEKNPEGILAPFRKARWMKYAQDNLRNPTQRVLLPPAIRYFTKKYQQKDNHVVSIQLKRKWAEVHPFSNHKLPAISNTPRIVKHEVLFNQKITR